MCVLHIQLKYVLYVGNSQDSGTINNVMKSTQKSYTYRLNVLVCLFYQSEPFCNLSCLVLIYEKKRKEKGK